MTNSRRNALRQHSMNSAAAMGDRPRVHRYQSAGAIMLTWSRREIILFFVVFSIRFSRGTACRSRLRGHNCEGAPAARFSGKIPQAPPRRIFPETAPAARPCRRDQAPQRPLPSEAGRRAGARQQKNYRNRIVFVRKNKIIIFAYPKPPFPKWPFRN